MGWHSCESWTRKSLITELKQGQDADTFKSKMVVSCYKGGPGRGVLWSVWEVTEKGLTKFIIACDLLQYNKRYGWSYKPMDESMGPCYYSCPMKYLNMVPVVNAGWRAKVLAYHAERQRRPSNPAL